MALDESISRWLIALRGGDAEAVRVLWECYFDKLVRLARKRLGDIPRLASEPEDVALSAFASFCDAAANGRFPDLNDRDSLWRLLVVITARKASDEVKGQLRAKRGGDRVIAGDEELAVALSREPDPAFAAEVAEEFKALLDQLDDDELRRIAIRRMEGHSVEEIAREVRYVPRTVKRKLQLIRTIWDRQDLDERTAERE